MHIRKIYLFIISSFFLLSFASCTSNEDKSSITVIIDTDNGHNLQEGCSGFNVRIADKVWGYNHPDFKEAVHTLNPGWLRYFSGTMGDAFNCATGLYDKDYASMFQKPGQYIKGYKFTDVKGPHRIIDLYEVLGEVGGKLIVTINGFSETPKVAGELARFCKNNNIEVEAWQFCNEPYFYVPHRDRYWWNNGYDYAAKMKPYADSIKAVYPDAQLALNCTWDGIWGFMKEINRYQKENGAYWNTFSKHSYAPHVGGHESFEKAYMRGNSKVISATNKEAMAEIEDYSWKGVPMIITEFGVWNRSLNGIYSAIYVAEYTLRQLQHPNTQYIGSHEISSKCGPKLNLNKEILAAYKSGVAINTRELRTGTKMDDEGKALKILHEATNNTLFTWDTEIVGCTQVDGLKGEKVDAIYARAFKGINGYDYLAVTNRSGKSHSLNVMLKDKPLKGKLIRKYISSENPQKVDVEIVEDKVRANKLEIPAYSVVLVKWESHELNAPNAPRIYKAKITSKGVSLDWWKRDIASSYELKYGQDSTNLDHSILIKGNTITNALVSSLEKGSTYYFGVLASGKGGESKLSDMVTLKYELPKQPKIFKTATRDTTITIMWESVAGASGYHINVEQNGKSQEIDANNVFGYRIDGLKYDTPYAISVSAYNGLGAGLRSEIKTVVCKKHLPIPPKNISAKRTGNGDVFLHWTNQDSINPDVKYRIYRGNELHKFSPLVDNISADNYTDKSVEKGKAYFYTVKSYNADGECSFYPNIATIIEKNKQVSINVKNIEKTDSSYLITVKFSNIRLDGDIYYGVALSDISYLTVEEELFKTKITTKRSFKVEIPLSKIKKGRTYAIKGFVNTNGKPIYSLPPHKKIKAN